MAPYFISEDRIQPTPLHAPLYWDAFDSFGQWLHTMACHASLARALNTSEHKDKHAQVSFNHPSLPSIGWSMDMSDLWCGFVQGMLHKTLLI